MGKKKSSTQTSTSNSSNQSWLMDIDGLQDMANGVVSNSTALPDYVYEGLNDTQKNALQSLIQGRDQSQLTDNANYLNNAGQSSYGTGTSNLASSADAYSKYANMSQADYQGMISGAMNSDLVNQQKAISNRNIQDSLNANVQALNQSATATGNMGNSRAGVAQGVMTGKALQAQSDANTAIDQNAYTNAISAVNNQISTGLSGASGLSTLGQYQSSQGLNAVGNASTLYNQIQNNNISDLNNAYTAGTAYQTNAQNQANVNYQNAINQSNPYLGQWQQIVNALSPAASWSQTGTNTTTQTVSGGSGGWASAIGGLAGAGIGGYFGGSQGAAVGSGVGSGVGGAFR